ncbi:MAG: sodium:proton antiporter NhaD [Bacteroidaceae bacterium]|nr:sodium:proton antiporter NhaD [Bacteroidaceae bacterium]
MWIYLLVIFFICYLLIALEHILNVNKSAISLFLAVVLWTIVLGNAADVSTLYNAEKFSQFLLQNPAEAALSLHDQSIHFLIEKMMVLHLGDISETLFFLLGAMTIVELIDQHGGFNFITQRIKTRKIRTLLWTIAFISFFLSALLDNLTTSIIMIMLVRKIITHRELRWWMCGVIIIAANTGGAWSPIGDVTTIMLWVKGNITALPTVTHLILPSLVAMVVPLLFITYRLRGVVETAQVQRVEGKFYEQLTQRERMIVLVIGVIGLLCVPIFKSITGMPPFMGILFVLSILWIYTEIVYRKRLDIEEHRKNRVSRVISHIDMSTILFFLGILMAVSALQVAGILNYSAIQLDNGIHNIYFINGIIGVFSSIVDNVPLVAGAIGMYDIPTFANLSTMVDPVYSQHFMQDCEFWQLTAYCAGVGGSMLIIGSAAGVVAMGLEKITFAWYFKRFTLLAFIGYLAGLFTYWLQIQLIG